MENYLAGTASLVEHLDKKMLVVLRDGKKLIGILRSFDQYGNLVLQDTLERIYVKDSYGDIPRGIYLIRGENVFLCGDIDVDKEESIPLRELPVEEVIQLQKEEAEALEQGELRKHRIISKRGLAAEFGLDHE